MKPVFGMINIQADERGRLRVPALYRASLGDTKIYGYKNKNGNYLSIFGQDTLDDMLAKLSDGVGVEEDDSVKLMRDFYMSIVEVVEDKQGRFTLPNYLREELGISKDLIFIGMGKKIELWDKAVYDAYVADRRSGKSDSIKTKDGSTFTY